MTFLTNAYSFGISADCRINKSSVECLLSQQIDELNTLSKDLLAYNKGLVASKKFDEYDMLTSESEVISMHHDLINSYRTYLQLKTLITDKKNLIYANEVVNEERVHIVNMIDICLRHHNNNLQLLKFLQSREYILKSIDLLNKSKSILSK